MTNQNEKHIQMSLKEEVSSDAIGDKLSDIIDGLLVDDDLNHHIFQHIDFSHFRERLQSLNEELKQAILEKD